MSLVHVMAEAWSAIAPAVYMGVAGVIVRVLLLLSQRVKNTTMRQNMEALAYAVDRAVRAEYQRTVKALKDPNNADVGMWTPEAAREVKAAVIDTVRTMIPPVISALRRRGYDMDVALDVELERSVLELNEHISQFPPPLPDTPAVQVPPQDRAPLMSGTAALPKPGPRRTTTGSVFAAVKSAISADATGQMRLPRELKDTDPETPGAKKGPR